MLVRIIVSFMLTAIINIIGVTGYVKLGAFLITYLIIGYDILKKALLGIINGRLFDENFLMAIATVGAFSLAIYSKSGDYNEAVAVMLFYQTGELFQSCAVGKSRKNIAELMDIRPDYANIEKDGILTVVSPDTVLPGTVIIVQPGERIPIDGIVEEGKSNLDTMALTGESLPRTVSPGEEVLSGCVNINSVLKIRTTKSFKDSTVSRILELVENAGSRKSRTEKFISRFARVYAPAVCIAALCLALIPPIITVLVAGRGDWAQWIYRALTFLVISCPCALVISIPLSFFAAIGGASREGILIKGSNYLEALAQVKHVAFDKTGTLTEGVFKVQQVLCTGVEEHRLIELAAMAECASSHPIAGSIRDAYGTDIDRCRISDIEEISGMGVVAAVDGLSVAVGNVKLMQKMGVVCAESCHDGTCVYVAVNREYAGRIIISDTIKESAHAAIMNLKKLGIKQSVMLTGDSEKAANEVGNYLNIDKVYSSLLPEDKITALEKILDEKRQNEKVAFVGDGINDAPVIARADVGIAMGAMGSDAAIEAADIVLMDDDPVKIAKAIEISHRCLGIVRQNIVFSLVIKFLCLGLVGVGFANMWFGIFADVGVMVLAVLNSIRTLKK